MQLLLVIIEKMDDGYSAYSPNLTGLIVKAASREAVEQEIVAAVEKRLADLQNRHRAASERLKLSPQPIEDIVKCTFGEDGCGVPGKKDGLCPQHWRMLYGHALHRDNSKTVCLLCGEKNQWVLENWHYPCLEKSENPDWSAVLLEKRQRVHKLKKAKRGVTTNERFYESVTQTVPALPPPPQAGVPCVGVKSQGVSKGQPCSNESQKDGLCHAHWKKRYGHAFSNFLVHRNGCQLCGERNTDILFKWDNSCPKRSK
jgi:predicted RNase H-like HicB family nuclease